VSFRAGGEESFLLHFSSPVRVRYAHEHFVVQPILMSGNFGDGFAAVVRMCLNALMKIPIRAKIPRSYGPAPLQRGRLGDFSGVVPDHCGSFSCAVLYRLVHELL